MTKKDYQALARAIYQRRKMAECIQNTATRLTHYTELTVDIADVLQADNPGFIRERFIEACETSTTRGMRKGVVSGDWVDQAKHQACALCEARVRASQVMGPNHPFKPCDHEGRCDRMGGCHQPVLGIGWCIYAEWAHSHSAHSADDVLEVKP